MRIKKAIAATLTLSMMTLSACVVSPDGQPSGSIQIPVPVVITESPKVIIVDKKDTAQSQSIHVCQIQAFTQTYAAEDTNKGKAKLQAKKTMPSRVSQHALWRRKNHLQRI